MGTVRNVHNRRPPGRPKGTPNKRTKELLSILNKYNYDPLVELMELYKNGGLPINEKLLINIKLLSFAYPQIKQTDYLDPNKSTSKALTIEFTDANPIIKTSD